MSEENKFNPDFSKPLPTERRAAGYKPEDFRKAHAHDAQYMSGVMSAGGADGGSSMAAGLGPVRHDAAYYEQWRKEQQAAVERGEDPVADFAKRAREHSDNQPLPRLIKKVGKLFGKGKSDEKDADLK